MHPAHWIKPDNTYHMKTVGDSVSIITKLFIVNFKQPMCFKSDMRYALLYCPLYLLLTDMTSHVYFTGKSKESVSSTRVAGWRPASGHRSSTGS